MHTLKFYITHFLLGVDLKVAVTAGVSFLDIIVTARRKKNVTKHTRGEALLSPANFNLISSKIFIEMLENVNRNEK